MNYEFNLWNNYRNQDLKYLFLDTETTGFNPIDDCIIQLSFILVNNNFECDINEIEDYIISITDNSIIRNSNIHGITNEICKNKGILIIDALKNFYNKLIQCTHIVAYNAKFDLTFIKVALVNINTEEAFLILSELNSKIILDPMIELRHIVIKNGKYNMGICYENIVGNEIEKAHNSKYDVYNLVEIIKVFYLNFHKYEENSPNNFINHGCNYL